jgi:TRAP-type C4-dicarboxylate transport system permease small subunit
VTIAVIVGLGAGKFWSNAGVEYFSNMLNWLQSASTLTLVGGLRSPGLVTRLTLWVALLGASIATAQGKHINVDIVMRFLTPRLRLPVAVLGWVVAATVCGAGVIGFFDTIAIEGFKARISEPCADDASKDCPTTFGNRAKHSVKEMRTDAFLLGRQISLDLKTLPKVLTGKKYNEYLKAPEWNEWLKGASWGDHFNQEEVDGQLMDPSQPDATRNPIINVPGSGEDTNGLLVRDLNLVFPFGLLMITLRFLLRSILAIGGAVRVDPDVAHGEGGEAHEGAEDEDLDGKKPEAHI